MMHKTQSVFKRFIRTQNGSHAETVLRETWLLLWIVPIYTRDSILSHNL